MLVTDTYTGQNGAMGYRTGQSYQLQLELSGKGVLVRSKEHGTSLYPTLLVFLQNWRNISLVVN